MRQPILTLVLIAFSLTSSEADDRPASESSPETSLALRGLVSLIEDVEVPAERAGILTSLAAKEGDELAEGALIAEIDAEQATLQQQVAEAEAATAQAKAANELDVRYAEAEHRVRKTEHQIALISNAKQPNAVSLVEVERLRLAAEQAEIKTGVSKFERTLRASEAQGFAAKAKLAAVDVRRRKVAAPLSGEVAEVFYRTGEWVEPGKPIVRVVRLDRLRVETFVRVADRLPRELIERPVTVAVKLARERRETFSGRVTFVNPAVQPGGEYRVWAEVDNRRDGGHWLLRPGMEAEIVVDPPARR